jgi:hypothetical protein
VFLAPSPLPNSPVHMERRRQRFAGRRPPAVTQRRTSVPPSTPAFHIHLRRWSMPEEIQNRERKVFKRAREPEESLQPGIEGDISHSQMSTAIIKCPILSSRILIEKLKHSKSEWIQLSVQTLPVCRVNHFLSCFCCLYSSTRLSHLAPRLPIYSLCSSGRGIQ